MPDFTPDQLNIINELNSRRMSLNPQQQQALDELRSRMPQQQSPAFNSSNSSMPFLGNLLDQLGRNIQAIPQSLGAIANMPAGMDPQTGQFPPSLLERMVLGVGQQVRDQWSQAGQDISGGDVLGGTVRAGVGSIPVLGPDVMKISDQFRSDPGGATANLLSLIAQMNGPEIIKGVTAPERAVGQALYKQAFKFPEDVGLAERARIRQLGLDIQVPTGKSSLDMLGDVNKPDTFMGQLEKGVQDNIKAVRTQPVAMSQVFKPLLDEINSIDPRAPGADKILKSLNDELDSQMGKFGWKPSNPKHPLYDKNYPHGRSMQPITVEEAQKLKRDTYNLLSDKYYGDKANASNVPGEKQAHMLLARGFKDAIEDKAPGVKSYNDTMHNTIGLIDALTDMEKRNPGVLQNWGRYIVGGGGALMGAGLAEASGQPLLGGAALAGVLAATIARDPAAATRFGLAMSKMGIGVPSKVLGYTPLAGRLLGQGVPQDNQ